MEKKKSLSFSRKQRLVNQAEFDSVFGKAKKISHKCVLALYRPNEHAFSRLGIIVSKRVAKKAVTRNQIKRVIRESFRAVKGSLKGNDIIVLARQNNSAVTKTELRRIMEQLWEKLIACQQNV